MAVQIVYEGQTDTTVKTPPGFRFGQEWNIVDPACGRRCAVKAPHGNGAHILRTFFGMGADPHLDMANEDMDDMKGTIEMRQEVMERHAGLDAGGAIQVWRASLLHDVQV